jgi:O-antigen/teichoic acid export membrane protein
LPSIKKNYFYNLLYQLIAIATPLITTPYISRKLGAEGVGIYSFTFSITTYFTIFAIMGTSYYGQREIAYCGDDMKKRSSVFFEVLFFRCLTTLFALLIFIPMVATSEYRNVFLVQGLNLIAVAFDISWFFMGLEQFRKTSLRNAFVKLAGVILVFLLVKDSEDLVLYCVAMGLPLIIANLSLFPMLRGQIKFSVLRETRINPFHNMKTILSFFLPTIAVQVYTVLDKTMIGFFTDTAVENGYYEQAEKIVKSALTVITALGTVTLPRVSALHAKNDDKSISQLIFRSFRFVLLLSFPMVGGLIVLAPQFSPWFFGTGFDQVPSLITVLSLLLFAIGLNNAIGIQYLITTGKQNVFTLTVIIGAVINFGINLLLIPRIFAMGAAIATVIAESVITAVQFIYTKRIFPFSKVLAMCPKYFISTGFMVIVLLFLRQFLGNTFVETIVLVMVGASIYAVLLFVLHDIFFIDILKKGINILKRVVRL